MRQTVYPWKKPELLNCPGEGSITAPKAEQVCGLQLKASSTQRSCRPVWNTGIMNPCRYWGKKKPKHGKDRKKNASSHGNGAIGMGHRPVLCPIAPANLGIEIPFQKQQQ